MNTENTVYVVDDQPVIRKALRFLLESVPLPVETFASAEEFLHLPRLPRNGCLLLDIRLDGMDGMELHRVLKSKHCGIPVIFITGHGDVQTAVEAIKAGAFDFIEKPFNDHELLAKIRLALRHQESAGGAWEKKTEFLQRIDTLSKREREVLQEMVAGHLNKEMAHEMGISRKTVEIHRANVFRKLNMDSLAELIRYYTVCEMEGKIRPLPHAAKDTPADEPSAAEPE